MRVSSLSRTLLLGFLAIVAVAVGVGMFHYWPDHAAVKQATSTTKFAAPGVTFPTAEITQIDQQCGGAFQTTGAPVCWTIHAKVDSGDHSGEAISVTVQGPGTQSGLKAGDVIQVMRTPASGQKPATYSYYGVDRAGSLGWLALAFVIVVLLVARLRGLLAIVGLGIAGVVLIWFMLPALLVGENGTAVTAVGAGAIIYVVLYLTHGPSLRTSTALAGTLGGAAVTGLIAFYAVDTSRLSGIADDQSALLATYLPHLDFRALLTGAIMIAGLGVLNDVTITQASAVWELRGAGPHLNRRQLFTRAMRIGRDHIASTIYTIVFAYTGAALTVLLLLYIYDRPILDLLGTEDLATEVARTLCSAMGLVLAVPLTTVIASMIVAGPAEDTEHEEPLLPRHRL